MGKSKEHPAIEPGQQFDRLTVVGLERRDERRRAWWRCECSCGKTNVVRGDNLTNGNTQSCGCLGRERRRNAAMKRWPHRL